MSWTELIEELTGIVEEAAATEDFGATFEIELSIKGVEQEASLAGEWFLGEAGLFLEIQLKGMNELSATETLLDMGWTKTNETFVCQVSWKADAVDTFCTNITLAFERLSISEDDLNIESVSLFGLDDD